MSEVDYCLVSGRVLSVTERAVLLDLDNREQWIPRSVIEDGEDVVVFQTDLYVAEWFVEKEGL